MMIPMMQAYVNTGDFSIAKRIKSAFHVNVRFYSIYVVVGIVGLVYLIFANGYTKREIIQGYVMAAANSWGLLLVIVFMGYGLVSVPRNLWYSGNYVRHLHQLYASASRLKEECMDSELEFNELAKTMNAVSKRSMDVSPELRYCINQMVRRFSFVLHETFSERDRSITVPRDLTEDYLVKLCRRMVLAIRMKDRKNALWKNLLNEAFYLQDIIANKDRAERRFDSSLRLRNNDKWTKASEIIEWWWVIRIQPLVNKALAIIFSIVSICILWSELTFNIKSPIISITMSFLTLTYMSICVYSSLFKIRFFNLYLLIPNHHTDENSLLWFTGYLCKMMAPLCYNYINLAVDIQGTGESVFSKFMGHADLVAFLGTFADWFPIVILIPSLSLLLNIQGRCLGLCGIKSPYRNDAYSNDDDMESNNESNQIADIDYEEGEKLVQEERQARERNGSSTFRNNKRSRAEAYNSKYGRVSPPQTLGQSSVRSKRDQRIDEILSGRTRYHDDDDDNENNTLVRNNIPESSSSSISNVGRLGEALRQKWEGLFPTKSNGSTDRYQNPSTEEDEQSNEDQNHSYPIASSTGGRVFGRPSQNNNNDSIRNNYSDVGNSRRTDSNIEAQSGFLSRSPSPNPFLMASGRNRLNNSNNTSPFIRFGGEDNDTRPPSRNIFDDI
ncbi:hypothetical protein K501DRAFT_202707 [Backusella circina FSU 941]|nr:hypothetical protein K501DRAFT_202707 [Backusella circina FSU 941]